MVCITIHRNGSTLSRCGVFHLEKKVKRKVRAAVGELMTDDILLYYYESKLDGWLVLCMVIKRTGRMDEATGRIKSNNGRTAK